MVYAVFVSVRLTHGTLISGALATRFSGIADRQVPPALFGAWEWERRFRGSAGPDTLLGPEETDRLGGHHRWVVASGFARLSLVKTAGRRCSSFAGPAFHHIGSHLWVWVSGDGSGLVAVCCLRFA